jgi:hypothetical protein
MLRRSRANSDRDGRFDELEEPYPATAEAMAEASDKLLDTPERHLKALDRLAAAAAL